MGPPQNPAPLNLHQAGLLGAFNEIGERMSGQSLQRLIDLVTFDRDVLALETTLAAAEAEAFNHQQAVKHAQALIEGAKAHARSMTKLVDEKELALKEVDEELAEKKKRFDKAADVREYKALKAETEQLMELQQQLESEVSDAWTALENAQRDANRTETEQTAVIAQHEGLMHAQDDTLRDLKERIVEKALVRNQLEQLVTEEWRERYKMMRKRVADPVVPLTNDACSGCFTRPTKQDQMRLKRGAVLVCSGCYRFLFDPTSPVHSEGSEEPS